MINRNRFGDLYSVPEKTPEINRSTARSIKAIKDLGDTARACLNSELFALYRKKFELVQARMIDTMIAYDHDFFRQPNGDINIYAVNMSKMIQRIVDLRVLLNNVESDAQKGKFDEKEVSKKFSEVEEEIKQGA